MKSNTKKIIGFAGLGAVILIVVIAICLIPNRPQYATAKGCYYRHSRNSYAVRNLCRNKDCRWKYDYYRQ